MSKKTATFKITMSALCIALGFLLPFFTAQNRALGNALSLIHIPAYLCGFLCGPEYGLIVGFLIPILRSLFFGMPPLFPLALSMGFEMAAYGFFSGYFYTHLKKTNTNIYLTLLFSLLIGRTFWGISRFFCAKILYTEFTFPMFLAGAFTTAIPGIIIQLVIIPLIIIGLKKATIL